MQHCNISFLSRPVFKQLNKFQRVKEFKEVGHVNVLAGVVAVTMRFEFSRYSV